ncbi:c-type cytochrome [Bradyrhizobium retamae]|uniref:c-type cytochrome n=1 Tax=Bradyrhizobium retamae TaxID=1300035 RepID=UPI003D311FCD
MTGAGDCASCHTADPAKPFAGGKRIDTPFGGIYAPNLTPDRETGLGAWNDDDFYRPLCAARHSRRRRDRDDAARPQQGIDAGLCRQDDDQEIADVMNYIRNAWGNAAPLVTAAEVANARRNDRGVNDRVPDAMQPFFSAASQSRDPRFSGPRISSITPQERRAALHPGNAIVNARTLRESRVPTLPSCNVGAEHPRRPAIVPALDFGMLTEEPIHGIPTRSEGSLPRRPER